MSETQTPSLVDQLFLRLQEKVRSGEWAPGARFPTQREIALDAKVSRTVVREAVARLASQGLIVSRQGSGVYVAPNARYQAFQVTKDELARIEDVIKLLEMRLAVETEMAGLAAERRTEADLAEMAAALRRMAAVRDDADAAAEADAAFHVAIARATKNEYYERFVAFLGVRLVPPRTLVLKAGTESESLGLADAVAGEHEALLDAIRRGDAAAARRSARAHMQASLERHLQVNALAKGEASTKSPAAPAKFRPDDTVAKARRSAGVEAPAKKPRRAATT